MDPGFEEYFRHRRREIDSYLANAIPERDGLPSRLRQAMCYSLTAPGKRLRPFLVLLAWEACAGEQNPWPAAMAVEMAHVYSLIHDDLPAMDDDDMRRGQETCHRRFDEATAILAGDALLTFSFEVLSESYSSEIANPCCGDLSRAIGPFGMVGGQMDDLLWENDSSSGSRSLKDLEFLHMRKTGALIRCSLRLGARVGHGVSPPAEQLTHDLELFDNYGQCLGLLFQITDDLLDVEGNTEEVGKKLGKDATRGKLTYPGLVGIEESKRLAANLGNKAREILKPLQSRGKHLNDLISFILTRTS
ncbi:MAG: polyprenyl synthetase family protein [Gemmataceae bacterium]